MSICKIWKNVREINMMTQLNRIHDILKTPDSYNPNNLKSTSIVLYRFDTILTGDELLPGK